MTKPLMTIAIFLCLAGVAGAQWPPKVDPTPEPGYEVVVYPEEVYFGDSVYIGIRLKNISDKVVGYDTQCYDRESFWLSLLSENIPVPYHLLREYVEFHVDGPYYSSLQDFQPGESVLIFVACQELPALEDMNFPFWEEAKKRLESGESIIASIGMEEPYNSRTPWPEPNYGYVSKPLLIKPRPSSEMELLQNWLEGTPERLRPAPFDQLVKEGNYFEVYGTTDEFEAIVLTPKPGFVSKERYLKLNRNTMSYHASNEHFIQVQGKDYFPYYFVRRGNRKPGDPVCPKTWQGWKELEESLSPSTMRDEIRLTRIIIQYCDTQDEKVLTELKEWFADMNELQRWSMIYSILEREGLSRMKDALNPSFRDVYHAIREYDNLPTLIKDQNGWL